MRWRSEFKTKRIHFINSPRQRSAGKADGPAAEVFFLPDQVRAFGDLAAEADRKLFRAVVTDPRHVLSRLLPEVKSTSYNRYHDNSSTDFSSTTLRLQIFRLQIFRLL